MVQTRSESEVTVTLSSSTMLDVLINPPYIMLVLSEQQVQYNDLLILDVAIYDYTGKEIYKVMLLPKFHRRPVVVVVADGPPIGIKPQ